MKIDFKKQFVIIACGVLLGITGTVQAVTLTGTLSSGGGGYATVVASPVASLAVGVHNEGAKSVTLTATNAEIRYTTDGSVPNCSTSTLYSSVIPLPVSSSVQTIKALSCYSTGAKSGVVSFEYTINAAPTPPASSGGGGGSHHHSSGGSTANPDTTKPVVTLIGETPVYVPLNGTYVEQGATATDNVTASSSLTIIVNGDVVDTSVAGTYYVAYRTTDAAGNVSDDVIRDVHVQAPSVAEDLPTGSVGGGSVLGVSTFKFLVNLHLGMRHNDVTELQNRLTAEGHYTGPVTGYFGNLTLAAAKSYQAAHGVVPVSGYVGPLTRAELNSTAVNAPATAGQTAAVVNGLTQAQREAIQGQINAAMALLQALMAQLANL